jgi:hypothetical protein
MIKLHWWEDEPLDFEDPDGSIRLNLRAHSELPEPKMERFALNTVESGSDWDIHTYNQTLVTAFRMLIAEDKLSADNFELWLCNNDQIRVTEYGAIPGWPYGFCDHSCRYSERILRGAFKKREEKK